MVYGPGDRLRRFYPVVKRIADGRDHIIFAEALAAWRSPRGYVENVAAAIAQAATDDRAERRIYNVCEEPSFSELEWARKIASEMGGKVSSSSCRWNALRATCQNPATPRSTGQRVRCVFATSWGTRSR
jgi:nucleoside-diphosphate-sugar epimerase